MSSNKRIDVIGVQMDLGASRRGVNMGPLAIRHCGLLQKLGELGYEPRDCGDIVPNAPQSDDNPAMHHYKEVNESNGRLYQKTCESIKDGAMPIILGGDHSIAAGSIPAVADSLGKIGVIWIDAHGDFNNDESSPSGNMHGMPLSAVCGCGPDAMVAFARAPRSVEPRNAVLVGSRDLDENERKRLRQYGVTVFSMNDVDKLGMAEVMRRAIQIAGEGTEGIHVSFDVDAVTPEFAPGTGTPVHSGLTVREAFLAAEMLFECGEVVSFDMVEVNPMLDTCNKTGILACELILSMLGKTLY